MPLLKIPYVIERTKDGARQVDIYTRLLGDRIIMLTGEVNDDVAEIVMAQLFYLESESPERDIHFYIDSPGGVVTAGLAIYDAMQYISCDVATICVGQAASMGAVLLAGGAKGKRMAFPHARIMIHQPLGGAQGQASDMEIQVKEMLRIRKELNALLAEHTGQSIEVINRDTDRDFFMTAEEAAAYGVIDGVVAKRKRPLP